MRSSACSAWTSTSSTRRSCCPRGASPSSSTTSRPTARSCCAASSASASTTASAGRRASAPCGPGTLPICSTSSSPRRATCPTNTSPRWSVGQRPPRPCSPRLTRSALRSTSSIAGRRRSVSRSPRAWCAATRSLGLRCRRVWRRWTRSCRLRRGEPRPRRTSTWRAEAGTTRLPRRPRPVPRRPRCSCCSPPTTRWPLHRRISWPPTGVWPAPRTRMPPPSSRRARCAGDESWRPRRSSPPSGPATMLPRRCEPPATSARCAGCSTSTSATTTWPASWMVLPDGRPPPRRSESRPPSA